MSSSAPASNTVSSKKWCITYVSAAELDAATSTQSERGECFLWRNGCRLRGRGGCSVGAISSVSVSSESSGILKFTFKEPVGHTFCVRLSLFQDESNSFTKKLAPYTSDSEQFCMKLNEFTDGSVMSVFQPIASTSATKPSSGGSKVIGKRKLPPEDSSTSSPHPKKSKHNSDSTSEDSGITKEITSNSIGVMDVPVDNMRDPPEYLRVREVKQWYVDYLSSTLADEKDDHEDLSSPLLVVASVGVNDFKQRNMKSYTFEVIGGIQRFNAISKINKQREAERKIVLRKCSVYGNELSRLAKLTLAKQHNDINQIQRVTTFPEIVGCCRRLLFSHFGGGLKDDGMNMPAIPRYNNKSYIEYKKECLALLTSTQVSKPMIDQAIQMAVQPSEVYHTMQAVFQKHEEGKLKGQKRHGSGSMNDLTLHRALEGKLAAKLSHFKMFQGLKDEDKLDILRDINNRSISFEEAEKKALCLKHATANQDAFLIEVNLASWDEAEVLLKSFDRGEEFKGFKVQKGKKLSDEFIKFCARAKQHHEMLKAQKTKQNIQPTVKHVTTALFVAEMEEIPLVNFNETELIFFDIGSVTSVDSLKLTIGGISASLGSYPCGWTLILYNFTSILEWTKVEEACSALGAKYSRLITVCTSVQPAGDIHLASSKDIVVAWWGEAVKPGSPHILAEEPTVNAIMCFPSNEETMVATEGTGWMGYLLQSLEPSKVGDIYSQNGEATQLAHLLGMQCMCVLQDKEKVEEVAKSIGYDFEHTDTPKLLDELSSLEKLSFGQQARRNSTSSNDTVPEESHTSGTSPTRASVQTVPTRKTRSSGQELKWSKEMGASNPVE